MTSSSSSSLAFEITGELIPDLLGLVDQRTIRLMDVLIVMKADDGTVTALTPDDLDPAEVVR